MKLIKGIAAVILAGLIMILAADGVALYQSMSSSGVRDEIQTDQEKTAKQMETTEAVTEGETQAGSEALAENKVQVESEVQNENPESIAEHTVKNADRDMPDAQPAGYYYQQLPEHQKEAYDIILSGINHFMTEIPLAGDGSSSYMEVVQNIYQCVLNDHPEIFWMNGSSNIRQLGAQYTLEPGYTLEENAARMAAAEAETEAGKILGEIPTTFSDYEKLKYVYDWIISEVTYRMDCENSQNILSVFLNKEGVCAGYSKSVQYLLQKMGIPCIYATGNMESGQGHAWNIVKLDGEYYYVDVTWGDPVFSNESEFGGVIFYDYLCGSPELFNRMHKPDSKLKLPECSSEKYNYYRLNDKYFEDYDQNLVISSMKGWISFGETFLAVQFGSDQAYEEAYSDLFSSEKKVEELNQHYMKAVGITESSCYYFGNEESRVIIIEFQ